MTRWAFILCAGWAVLLSSGCRSFGPPAGIKMRTLLFPTSMATDIERLTDEDPVVRRWGIVRLRRRGRTDLATEIALLMDPRYEEDPSVRAAAARAVREMNCQDQGAGLAACLRDPHPLVRLEGLKGLRQCGAKEHLPPVLDVLRDAGERSELRVEAARAAGGIGDEQAVPDLIRVMDEPDPHLRFAAHQALVELTGADRGPDSANWLRWLNSRPEAAQSGPRP